MQLPQYLGVTTLVPTSVIPRVSIGLEPEFELLSLRNEELRMVFILPIDQLSYDTQRTRAVCEDVEERAALAGSSISSSTVSTQSDEEGGLPSQA